MENLAKRIDSRIKFTYKSEIYVINDGSSYHLEPTFFNNYDYQETPLMPIRKGDKGSWTVGESLLPYNSDSRGEIKVKRELYKSILSELKNSEEFLDLITSQFNNKVDNTLLYFDRLIA